jgi:hypothetical protein
MINMNWPTIIAILGLVGLFLLYLVPAISITRRLLGSDFFDPWQTRMQLLIVWLVPIFGAALVAAMLLPHIPSKRGHIPLFELLVLSAFVSSLDSSGEGSSSHTDIAGEPNGAPEDL